MYIYMSINKYIHINEYAYKWVCIYIYIYISILEYKNQLDKLSTQNILLVKEIDVQKNLVKSAEKDLQVMISIFMCCISGVSCLQLSRCIKFFKFLSWLLMPFWLSFSVLRWTCRQNRLWNPFPCYQFHLK
jgi:hypothetical protein